MAISKPLAVGIAFPRLAERYPDLAFRFWSRPESAFAGGYEWLGGGRASYTSSVATLGVGVQQASFQVTLTQEQVDLYWEGAFDHTSVEITWWWLDEAENEWRRVPRTFSGPMFGDKLVSGRILSASARTNPYPKREIRFLDNEDHQRDFPGDTAFKGVKRTQGNPRIL